MNIYEIEESFACCESINEMRLVVKDLLKGRRKILFDLPPEAFDSQKPGILYRGCKCEGDLQKDTCTLSRIKYPPKDKARQGRCNRTGQPIFYCSDVEIGAYCEINLKEGETFILSHWGVKESVPSFTLGDTYFLSRALDLGNIIEYREGDQLIDEWLTKIFTTEVPGDESVAVAEQLLSSQYADGRTPAAAIIYPSIKPDNKGRTIDNLAIKTEFFDKNIEFVLAEHIVVDAIRNGECDIRRLDHATDVDSDDQLVWKGYALRLYDSSNGDEYEISQTPEGYIGVNTKTGSVINLKRDAGSGFFTI